MIKEHLLKQIDLIINSSEELHSNLKHHSNRTCLEEITSIITSSLATIQRVTGTTSEYYKRAISIIEGTYDDNYNYSDKLNKVVGVIMALRSDIENDFLKSLPEIIHANIFSDYLEMAEHLLSQGYKDAAAVISGSTLESHIKQLCNKYDIETERLTNNNKSTPKKVNTLNDELAKAAVYNKNTQKQVTAWFGIRNSAAHGHYDEYSKEIVSLMIIGIRAFIDNYSA